MREIYINTNIPQIDGYLSGEFKDLLVSKLQEANDIKTTPNLDAFTPLLNKAEKVSETIDEYKRKIDDLEVELSFYKNKCKTYESVLIKLQEALYCQSEG